MNNSESNNRPGQQTTTQQLESLKNVLLKYRPPYCAGVLPLQLEDLILFYGKEEPGSLGRIDFSNVTEEALEHLSQMCDKATFGRKHEDVLDESYRNAGKLDSKYFSTNIDIERSGLLTTICYNLLQRENSHRPIKAELYKLNVYGTKRRIFKAHKDTPRSTTMFGSLVLVLPTQHEGGALILRNNDKEWTFDSAKALSEFPGSQAHLGYIAFFSDVEHEVSLVKSGYRVTITYNLYYDDGRAVKNLKATNTLPPNESMVTNTLGALLNDVTFLPDGGYLGFGLNHEYPIEMKPKNESAFGFISRNLKGSDAVLLKACRTHKLHARLYLCYENELNEDTRASAEVIVPHEVDLILDSFSEDANEVWEYLKEEHGAHLISFPSDYHPRYRQVEGKVDFPVHWVTDKAAFNAHETLYGAYGNEPAAEYMYGQFCLIVKVGPAGSRRST